MSKITAELHAVPEFASFPPGLVSMFIMYAYDEYPDVTKDFRRFVSLYSWYKHLSLGQDWTFYALPAQHRQQRKSYDEDAQDGQLHWYLFPYHLWKEYRPQSTGNWRIWSIAAAHPIRGFNLWMHRTTEEWESKDPDQQWPNRLPFYFNLILDQNTEYMDGWLTRHGYTDALRFWHTYKSDYTKMEDPHENPFVALHVAEYTRQEVLVKTCTRNLWNDLLAAGYTRETLNVPFRWTRHRF